MPQMTREALADLITARLPDNGGRFITPARMREVAGALADSVLLLGETPWVSALAALDAAIASLDAAVTARDAAITVARGRVRLFGAGDSRFADGLQGTPPYSGGYVLARDSAFNLALWALGGQVDHDARSDLFAGASLTLQGWIDAHLADLVAAVRPEANPIVLFHLGANSLESCTLVELQAQTAATLDALAGCGAHVVWLPESPRAAPSGISEAGEARRLAFNAWLSSQAGARLSVPNYLPGFTTAGTAEGSTALAGLQRDGLHDTQAGAAIKAAAIASLLAALPGVTGSSPYTGRSDTFNAATNPLGNKLANGQMTAGTTTPTDWTAGVRDSGDGGAGSSLTCAFSKATDDGRDWSVVTLGGTGGGGEQARLFQNPLMTGYSEGDQVRVRVRVRWRDLVNVACVRMVIFHYGGAFFGASSGVEGSGGAMPSGEREEILEARITIGASPNFLEIKLLAQATGTGPVSGVIQWAEAEIRKVAE